MPALPPIASFNGPTVTEGQYKAAFSDLRSYLVGLLGEDGTLATALGALGTLASRVEAVTAARTLVSGDRGKLLRANGTFALTLPDAGVAGDGWSVCVSNVGTGTITVTPVSSNLIEGLPTLPLLRGQRCILVTGGGSWTTLVLTQTGAATGNVTLNTAISPGQFAYIFSDPNAPVASSGVVTVQRSGSASIRQIAQPNNSNLSFQRFSQDTGASWSPWRPMYTTENILGTVALAGGVPTGAILERGSNANGSYLRLADGTQLCWHQITSSQAINTAIMGGFRTVGLFWTYPAAFSATPLVQAMPVAMTAFGAVLTNAGSNLQQQFAVTAVTSQTAANRTINLFASGNWS